MIPFKKLLNGKNLEITDLNVSYALRYVESKLGKDLQRLIPNFEDNYKLAQSKAKMGKTKRKDMPVISSKDIKNFQHSLEQGYIDVNSPYGDVTDEKNPFPEGLTSQQAKDWLEGGLEIHDKNKNDDKVKVKFVKVSAKDLIPIQEQIYFDKGIDTIIREKENTKSFLDSKTTIISSDNYVIDGHHRFLTALLLDPKYKVNCMMIDLPLSKLLPMSLSYGDAVGNPRNK